MPASILEEKVCLAQQKIIGWSDNFDRNFAHVRRQEQKVQEPKLVAINASPTAVHGGESESFRTVLLRKQSCWIAILQMLLTTPCGDQLMLMR